MKSKFLLFPKVFIAFSLILSIQTVFAATVYSSEDECKEAATNFKNGKPLAEDYEPTFKKANPRKLGSETVKALTKDSCVKGFVVGSKSKAEKDAFWVFVKKAGLRFVFDADGNVVRMYDCENPVFEIVAVEKPKQSKKEESQPDAPTAKIEGECDLCVKPPTQVVVTSPQMVATPASVEPVATPIAVVPTPALTPVGILTPVQLVPQGQPTQSGQQYIIVQPGSNAPAQTVVIYNPAPSYPAQPPVVQPPGQPPVYPPPYQPPGCYSPSRVINGVCTHPPGVVTAPGLLPPRQPGPVYPPPPPVVNPPVQGPGVVTNPPTLLPPVIGGPGGSGNQPVVGGPVYGGGGGYVNQPVVSAPRPNVVTSNSSYTNNNNNVYVPPPVNYGGGNTNNIVYVRGPVSGGQVNNNTTYLQIPAAPVQNGGVRPGTNTSLSLKAPCRAGTNC